MAIAGYPSESAHWSAKVIRKWGIQSLNTRCESLAASREKQQGHAEYNKDTDCHKEAYYQAFQANIILQFSTDYSCSKISVQTVSLARRARLSLGKKRLTTRVAGTSGREVMNDTPPRYKHH